MLVTMFEGSRWHLMDELDSKRYDLVAPTARRGLVPGLEFLTATQHELDVHANPPLSQSSFVVHHFHHCPFACHHQ